MNVIACVKSVVKVGSVKGLKSRAPIERGPEGTELNPFDRVAIEAALRLREAGGKVTALSMGPEAASGALMETMAMGADGGVLICDPAIAGSDTLATSRILAAAINKIGDFDLVLFGVRTSDSDTGQVGPQVAAALGLPFIGAAMKIETDKEGLRVDRSADGFLETYRLRTPAAISLHPASSAPRDVPFGGIETTYASGKITRWDLADLGLGPAQVGWNGSPTRVLNMVGVERDRKCEFLEGSPDEKAEALVKKLIGSGLIG